MNRTETFHTRAATVLSLAALLVSLIGLAFSYFTSPFSSVLVPRVYFEGDMHFSKTDVAGKPTYFYRATTTITNDSRIPAQNLSVQFHSFDGKKPQIMIEPPIQSPPESQANGDVFITFPTFPPKQSVTITATIDMQTAVDPGEGSLDPFFSGFTQPFHTQGGAIRRNAK